MNNASHALPPRRVPYYRRPPRVSIVLPYYNSAATLADCLQSIRRQQMEDYEVIAVDDGSDDESAAIVAAAAQQDARIQPISVGRSGLVAALNLGIAAARSTYIARMDADDLMHPQRLAWQVAALDADPGLGLIAGRATAFPRQIVRDGYQQYLAWQNSILTPEDVRAEIYVEAPFAHPTVCLRRSVLTAVSGYRDGDFAEDYDLWLRLHQAGVAMAKLPRSVLAWRDSGGRTSRTDPRYRREAFDRLRVEYLAHDPRLAGREIVYWGAGRPTRQRSRLLIERGFPPAAWIDIDPRRRGTQIWGAAVQMPEWLDRRPRPFVLVYINNHGARPLIAAQLQAYGYQRGVDFLGVG